MPKGEEWSTLARGALASLLDTWAWEEVGIPIEDTLDYWNEALLQTWAWESCPMPGTWQFYGRQITAALGNDGGTIVANTPTIRDPNFAVYFYGDDYVSYLPGSQGVLLKNGFFVVEWGAITYRCGGTVSQLYRAGSYVAQGTTQRSVTTDGVNVLSVGSYAREEDADGALYNVMSLATSGKTGNGLGKNSGAGNHEVYGYLNIWRKEEAA